MAYIHQHGIIHRNLNIDNIMLDLNYNVKLINFAQAKIVECLLGPETYSISSMTKNIGSMLFMSPEMMNDDEDGTYDYKTDVYSFGMVLYFIFEEKFPKYTLSDKAKRKPFPIPDESPLMSNSCINIISKCLPLDPKDRPSFKEILEEIRSISYSLANGIDQSLIAKRDQELKKFDNY